MRESWRWYGPLDRIGLGEIAQTGASGIVTALHEIPYGEVWTTEAVEARKRLVAGADLGLEWTVVESLPVHERIKRGDGPLEELFANYRQSMANLAAAGDGGDPAIAAVARRVAVEDRLGEGEVASGLIDGTHRSADSPTRAKHRPLPPIASTAAPVPLEPARRDVE